MSGPINGIAGRVHKDGGLPPAPHGGALEYTAEYSGGLYTVAFAVPFAEAPSVVVTAYAGNPQADIEAPLVSPTVYNLSTTSFSVLFWNLVPGGGPGGLNIFQFIQRDFNFAAMEISAQKKG